LRSVFVEGAYANLELNRRLVGFDARDAAFVTALVDGTCRQAGVYDRVIETVRPLDKLEPEVLTALRLIAHQALAMRVPASAAVDTGVAVAASEIGERVAGLVNAVGRRLAAKTLDQWLDELSQGLSEREEMALRTGHPAWIVDAWAERLPDGELAVALEADNQPARPVLAVRPGLLDAAALPDAEPARFSPFGAYPSKPPGEYEAVARGLAGVQDEGSQLVAWALTRPDAPAGPWLDLCAGPGGKTALLAGLRGGRALVAAEARQHRAELVAEAVRAYREQPTVVVADGRRPAWRPGVFARVLADVPCTGLGALRRRPDSRWRKSPADVDGLAQLQRQLLAAAVASAKPGGVVAYTTCSPHRRETVEVVGSCEGVEVLEAPDYLPQVPDCADGPFVQLWPHRHGTDAMFLALLRKL
jgi:16S rRNA (cytosine967-C5)-methyltransferase